MVAETQAPGASVSIVTRRHDVNSNQLFRWAAAAVAESRAMVPVEIAPDDGRPRRPDREGGIEIAFGCGSRVRLRGEVSSETRPITGIAFRCASAAKDHALIAPAKRSVNSRRLSDYLVCENFPSVI
jgi:transposase-like protein